MLRSSVVTSPLAGVDGLGMRRVACAEFVRLPDEPMLAPMRLFSTRHRPVHLGPFPLERLARRSDMPSLDAVPPMQPLSFDDPDPASLAHAMARYITMFDLVRDGPLQAAPAEIPDDPVERAQHLKAAAHYFDVSMVGLCALPRAALLAEPIRNPAVAALGEELERSQPKSFAAGMDMILADVLDSARKQHGPVEHHTNAIVLLVQYPRDPKPGEPGCEWIAGTQAQRAAVLSAQTATVLSTYLRMLGFEGACAFRHLQRRGPEPAGGVRGPGAAGPAATPMSARATGWLR